MHTYVHRIAIEVRNRVLFQMDLRSSLKHDSESTEKISMI